MLIAGTFFFSNLFLFVCQMKLGGVAGGDVSEDVGKTSILQAQVRDARKVALKLEEVSQVCE